MKKTFTGGLHMEIVIQTIRIIDYENNEIYVRKTPETFSDYIKQLIIYINSNKSVREYKTRSVNTEVIGCIRYNKKSNRFRFKLYNYKIRFYCTKAVIKRT